LQVRDWREQEEEVQEKQAAWRQEEEWRAERDRRAEAQMRQEVMQDMETRRAAVFSPPRFGRRRVAWE